MLCPFCQSQQLFVINSRPTKANCQIWRRRKCGVCHKVFTTHERVDLSYLKVIKRSGKKQRYSRVKLFSGIYHSAINTKNADKGDMAVLSDKLTSEVEQKILLLKKGEIRSTEIIKIVLSVIRKKAPDVFLRYLAYREKRKRLGKWIAKREYLPPAVKR